MAAGTGRDLLIKDGGTAIGGMRETTISWNGEPVDITNKGDSGYRTLASFSGMEAIDVSANGVLSDDTVRDIAFAGTGTTKQVTDWTLEWADGATLSGDFNIVSFESAGSHDGEETYDLSIQSSGAWTYTPSA